MKMSDGDNRNFFVSVSVFVSNKKKILGLPTFFFNFFILFGWYARQHQTHVVAVVVVGSKKSLAP